jgi:hypothetical protein
MAHPLAITGTQGRIVLQDSKTTRLRSGATARRVESMDGRDESNRRHEDFQFNQGLFRNRMTLGRFPFFN